MTDAASFVASARKSCQNIKFGLVGLDWVLICTDHVPVESPSVENVIAFLVEPCMGRKNVGPCPIA